MTDQEIHEALGATSPNSPIWRAIIELLDRAVNDCVEFVANPHQDDAHRHFQAGSLYQAKATRDGFIEHMSQVHRTSPGPKP